MMTSGSAAHLERLIHDLEFENTQLVKQIQGEEQEIEVLKVQKKENADEINKLEKENSELDEMIKHFHSLFTRNRQSVESSKRTLAILREHEDALGRELQMYKIQTSQEKKGREVTLAKYQGIWEEYSEIYESFDQSVQLRKLQASNEGAKMKLEQLKKLYRQKCLSENFKYTWVHERNAIIELASSWLEQKKQEQKIREEKKQEDALKQASQNKDEMSTEQESDQTDTSDETMEFHDASEFPQGEDPPSDKTGRESNFEESTTNTDEMMSTCHGTPNNDQQPQKEVQGVGAASTDLQRFDEQSYFKVMMSSQAERCGLQSTDETSSRNLLQDQITPVNAMPLKVTHTPIMSTAPVLSTGLPQPSTPNLALAANKTTQPPIINLPMPSTPSLRAPPVRTSVGPPPIRSPSIFMPPVISSTPLPRVSLPQRMASPLMPPPSTPVIMQRRSPPKLLVPASPNLKPVQVAPRPNVSVPMVNVPSGQPSKSPKKAVTSSSPAPCTPSHRNEVDSTVPSTSDAINMQTNQGPGTPATEAFQTPAKPSKSSAASTFKTPPHLRMTQAANDSPFNFSQHRSFLQSFVTESPGSDFRLPQKTMFKADPRQQQAQEKPKSFMSAADSSTVQGSPQVMSFLGSPWPANFGAGDASTSEGSFHLEGLFGGSAEESAKNSTAEATPSFSFGGGSTEATSGRGVMAMFGEGDNQDSDDFSFSFGKSTPESSPMSSAFKLF